MSNTRTFAVTNGVINGVSLGGLTTVNYSEGYATITESAGDGQAIAQKDRSDQFVRGSISCEDWAKMLSLLTGAVGNFVVYEKESGAATYLKHTFKNPVVHSISLNVANGSYSTITAQFECRAAATDTVVDLHATLAAQTLPAKITPARAGYRIVSAALGELDLLHATSLTLQITKQLFTASADGDIAHTAVDTVDDNMQVSGSLGLEAGRATSSMTHQAALIADVADLVITVKAAGGGEKVLTIKQVMFTSSDSAAARNAYATHQMPFTISDDGTLSASGETSFLVID